MSRPQRSFPADFKAQIVVQLLTGAANPAELCRKHNIKPQLLSHWKAAVLERMHMVFDLDDQTALLHIRIAELEQLVGKQAYELEILKKLRGCSLVSSNATGACHEARQGLSDPPRLSAA